MSLCPSRLRVGLHLLFLTLMLLPDTPLCLTVSKKDPGNLGSIIGSFNTTQEAVCQKACQAAATEGCKKGVFRNDTCWLLSCSDPCQEPDIPPLSGDGFHGNNGAGSALTTPKQTHSPLSSSSSLLSSGHHDTNLHQSQRNNTVQTLNPDGKSTNQTFVHQPLSDSIPPVTPVQEQPSVPPPPTSPPSTPSGKEPVDQSPKDLSPSIASSKQPVTPKDVLPQLAPIPSLPQVNLSTAALQSPNNTASSVPIEPDSNVSNKVFNNASIRLEPENNNNTVINTVQPGQGTTTKANETESVATPTNTPATRKATTPLPATAKTTMSAAATLPTTAKNITSTSVTVSTTAKSTTPTAVTTASTTVNTTVTAATTKKPSLTSVATQASMSPSTDNKPPVQSPSGSALGNASTSTIANAASSTTTANAVTNQKKHVVNTGGGVAMVEVTAGDLTSHLVDTASLLAVLLIGLLFFVVSVAVLVKQAYESYRRKDYTQVDYLINGMYTDSGV